MSPRVRRPRRALGQGHVRPGVAEDQIKELARRGARDLALAAAIGLVVTLVAGAFVPTTAFRLSGLTLPMLPGGPEQLAEDIEPVPSRVVVDRGTAPRTVRELWARGARVDVVEDC